MQEEANNKTTWPVDLETRCAKVAKISAASQVQYFPFSSEFKVSFKFFEVLTCLFSKQWKINIMSPCRELAIAKMYLKATVVESKARSPNNHVIPSKGRMTAEALIPALTLSICVLDRRCLVPII